MQVEWMACMTDSKWLLDCITEYDNHKLSTE